ncbi:MAG: protein-(glutamine-N5) methyltransferase, release factor-specific [Dehalococcoidales bacterium]|nr:protein-(glutamine-N5) methyltransferase, release factor-specific [Dehalococcoidales bacterium]MDP6449063.1 peptide chain release factor N(5)-glutamine methyltransferase [Dehalococcoidales bacterium]MDP6576394.1 peptide chain release factor N(5)-glutamine methyltransferase [Dehalococcoidales bacterium]MDP6824860.1 peptide chain release factor N(5)-glutamine methyltransferase [Dehalococcoidales bacterium]
MTLKQALAQTRKILVSDNIEDASLESELLLRHTLQIDRVQLYLDLGRELSLKQEQTLWRLVARRRRGEPTAYITGHREFYGLDFHVDSTVLIPRPESELLVEKTLDIAHRQPVTTIAEIGTGCGAIAVSLARHLPEARIYATDISPSAIKTARRNCLKHGVADNIQLLAGDMLDPLPALVDLIIANLPYVEASEIPRTGPGSFEPALALNGGLAGLEKVLRLCRQVSTRFSPRGCLLLEVGQGQATVVTTYLRGLFPSAAIAITPDLMGIERVVSLCLTPDYLDARLVHGIRS